MGWNRTGEETQIFKKRRGQAGSRVGALKGGGGLEPPYEPGYNGGLKASIGLLGRGRFCLTLLLNLGCFD